MTITFLIVGKKMNEINNGSAVSIAVIDGASNPGTSDAPNGLAKQNDVIMSTVKAFDAFNILHGFPSLYRRPRAAQRISNWR